jgi:hypothetical protein
MAGSSAVALAARRLARRLCLGPQHTASDVTPRLNPARRDPRVLRSCHTMRCAGIIYLYVDVPAGVRAAALGLAVLLLERRGRVGFVRSFCTLLIIDMS